MDFITKSFRKDETLTSWTLSQHICPHFLAWLLLYSAITPKNEDKYVVKVFNWSEFHLSEMTLLQNPYFSMLKFWQSFFLNGNMFCIDKITKYLKKLKCRSAFLAIFLTTYSICPKLLHTFTGFLTNDHHTPPWYCVFYKMLLRALNLNICASSKDNFSYDIQDVKKGAP